MSVNCARDAGSDRARRPLAAVARLALLLSLLVGSASAGDDAVRARALSAAFPGKHEVALRAVRFDAEDREALKTELRRKAMPEKLEFYEIRDERGDLSGWALQREVLGKTEPITYLVAFDAQKRVRCVEILAYRESHGGEVRREAFRKQFVGKGRESKLELGVDVRNVSGATISCRAITDGVHDDVLLLGRALESERADVMPSPREPTKDETTEEVGTRIHRTRLCMGTSLEITVADESSDLAHAAIDAAFAEAERLDALLSHYREDSDISRIGRAAGDRAVEIDADTLQVLAESRRLHSETDGAFDPCTGSMIRLWQRASVEGRWPSDADVEAARGAAGMRGLELDAGRSSARLADHGAAIDLGGIGKGFALDRMGEVLRRKGVDAAILNFGGQLLALDAPSGSSGWRVEISAADDRNRSVQTLWITNSSVATSSDSERGLSIGNRAISHVVDPRTGRPVEGCASATVCAPRATDADAWSTAAFVLGDNAAARADQHGIAILWQGRNRALKCNRSFDALTVPGREHHAAER
ncbi:MAG: FAD:protein FMN transferase [Planctomycetes bacterium]|nr:FAD:protein FMN transferase [Planctomycetota bacterium]